MNEISPSWPKGPEEEHHYARYFDDPDSLRRQFRVSILLVGAMAIAALAFGFLLPVMGKGTATAPLVIDSISSFDDLPLCSEED